MGAGRRSRERTGRQSCGDATRGVEGARGVVVKLESGLRERGKWPGELVEIAKDGRRVRFGSKNDLLAHGVLKKASGHGLT
jgi:hypothetical protein